MTKREKLYTIKFTMQASTWLPVVVAPILPAVIPMIPIFASYLTIGKNMVDREKCQCSCWDTVFKGTYESGVARYKHVYFNATENTTKIWLLSVIAIIALYECTKQLIKLMLQKSVRYSMVILFVLSIFPHYYGWWMCFNYWNDDFYSQWNHQLFFTITELISTCIVFHLADVKNTVTSSKVLCVISIAIVHIIAAGVDQGFRHIFFGEGSTQQRIRDIGFMVPDLLLLFIPAWLLWKTRSEDLFTKPLHRDKRLIRDILITLFFGTILLFIWRFLL